MPFIRTLPVAVLLLAVLVSGCNVFAPFYSEGGDVDALLEDARHARAAGNLNKAIELLERAYEREPSNPVVRLDLSSTLMLRERLTFLEVEAVTRHILDALGRGDALRGAARPAAEVCTFEPGTATGTFDPRGADGYAQIVSARPTLRRVVELLSDPAAPTEAPALPAAFTSLDVCEVITPTGLNYNRNAVLAAIRNQFSTDTQVTAVLSTASVAYTLGSYVALFEQPDLPVVWYTLPDDGLGACVAEAQYDLLVERAQAEVRQVGRSLFALDLLMLHSGQDEFAEYVEDALDLYASFEDDDLAPCP
jgi:hypothetical protein